MRSGNTAPETYDRRSGRSASAHLGALAALCAAVFAGQVCLATAANAGEVIGVNASGSASFPGPTEAEARKNLVNYFEDKVCKDHGGVLRYEILGAGKLRNNTWVAEGTYQCKW